MFVLCKKTYLTVIHLTVLVQVTNVSGGVSTVRGTGKEQFRSVSLPLGAQLNPDWSVSAPVPAQPAPPTQAALPPTQHDAAQRLTARVRQLYSLPSRMWTLGINRVL